MLDKDTISTINRYIKSKDQEVESINLTDDGNIEVIHVHKLLEATRTYMTSFRKARHYLTTLGEKQIGLILHPNN